MLTKNDSRITFNEKTNYALAISSGILLLLSFPPFRFGGLLAWIALVPLLVAAYYETRLKRIDRLVKIASLGSLPVVIWIAWWIPDLIRMAWSDVPSWLQQALFIVGLIMAIFATEEFGGEYVKSYWKPKSLPSKSLQYLPPSLAIFTVPLIWTSIEFLAMNIPGVMRIGGAVGFWSIAKTQWMNPLILQLASFTGMYGVTFLIVLVNCAIAYAMIHYKETKRIFKPTIIVLCVLAVILSNGLTGIPKKVEGNITVAVIQTPPTGENTAGVYINMSENALKYNPKIIIWPALMFEQLSINQHHNFSRYHNVYLVGSTGKDHEFGYGVLSPDGSISVDNLGHSMGTIPQYILARDVKGFFFPEVYSLKTEIGFFGVTDCIESGSALPTRDRVRDGAQFLVVPTGSPNAHVFSWALGTNAIYRAVEHRMFVAEVIGDYKGSMIIDPYGRTIEDIAPEPEMVVGKISFTNERTFYTMYGDVFGWGIVLTAMTLIAYNFHLKRKSQFRYCIECYANITKDAKVCPTCGKRQKRKWWARDRIGKLTKN